MSYSLFYTAESLKQLKKLEKSIQERVISTLERARIRPHAFVKKLIGSPYFRLRVGSYRVIIDIKENKVIIIVLEIAHRKKIYKK